MRIIDLSLWEKIYMLIGNNQGCNKSFVSRKLGKNYVTIFYTIDAMIEKGLLSNKGKGNINKIYVNFTEALEYMEKVKEALHL